jgi:hypothetical protein
VNIFILKRVPMVVQKKSKKSLQVYQFFASQGGKKLPVAFLSYFAAVWYHLHLGQLPEHTGGGHRNYHQEGTHWSLLLVV